MTQIEKLRFIRDHLSEEDILCQIAEEAAELAQAALKLQRAKMGTNPTPVDVDSAKHKLLEEIADVSVACDALTKTNRNASGFIEHFYISKLNRWVERLKQHEEEQPCKQN